MKRHGQISSEAMFLVVAIGGICITMFSLLINSQKREAKNVVKSASAFISVEDVEEWVAMPSSEWKALDEKLTAVHQKLNVFTEENAIMLERIQRLELLLENSIEQPVTFWMPDDS